MTPSLLSSLREKAEAILTAIRAGEVDPRKAAEALGLGFDQDDITALLEAVPALLSSNAELRRALEPFAKYADVIAPTVSGEHNICGKEDSPEHGHVAVKIKHFRAARAALNPEPH